MRTLRNAVGSDSESHAYLFSGPRGTGKTSTARILAKALNCEALDDGEPCGTCESCVAMDAGRSFDLFELDAASNNGVDAVRELVERAAVGSPGRTKVYILDEVHMLTAAASNALLKTLEEPPAHVRFVLATTEPQKVLPTIRSRTQQHRFDLLSAKELEDYVRFVAEDAGLEVDDEAVAHVVRVGNGSARDTLSALDQVVAAGGVATRSEPVGVLFDALEAGDASMAILGIADALSQGHDPRVLGEAFLGEVRDAFLLSLGAEVPGLVDLDRGRLQQRADAVGTAMLARVMESLGAALVEMRQAADPRIPLEVALVRCTSPEAAGGSAAGQAGGSQSSTGADAELVVSLQRRIERLEARLDEAAAAPEQPAEAPAPKAPAAEIREERPPATAPASRSAPAEGSTRRPPPPAVPTRRRSEKGPSAKARSEKGRSEKGRSAEAENTKGESSQAHTEDGPERSPTALPDRDALVMAFGDTVVPGMKGIAKVLYSAGRFVAVSGSTAVFAVENEPTRDRAERYRPQVEELLGEALGVPVPLRLITEAEAGSFTDSTASPPAGGSGRQAESSQEEPSTKETAGSRPSRQGRQQRRSATPQEDPADEEDDMVIDLDDLEDAGDAPTGGVEKLAAAFPGAQLVNEADES